MMAPIADLGTPQRRNSYGNSTIKSTGAATVPVSQLPPRTFRIIVKGATFEVDPEKMRRFSPVFASMCAERSGMAEREIVDEKVEDISTFLACITAPQKIDRKF